MNGLGSRLISPYENASVEPPCAETTIITQNVWPLESKSGGSLYGGWGYQTLLKNRNTTLANHPIIYILTICKRFFSPVCFTRKHRAIGELSRSCIRRTARYVIVMSWDEVCTHYIIVMSSVMSCI